MQITNKEEYKEIQISTLGLSTRSFNSLTHAGFNTLYLLIENADQLENLRNMGAKSIAEIEDLLCTIEAEGLPISDSTAPNAAPDAADEVFDPSSALPDAILNRPATDLHVSVRICNSFRIEGIERIGQVAALKAADILQMKNMGPLSQQQLLEELEQLKSLGETYFETDDDIDTLEASPKYSKRELDIATVKKLRENYGLKIVWLCEWYNLSRQSIYQKLSKRINHGQWCGKELLEDERRCITEMINTECFFKETEHKKYYLVNNMTDDCAFLIISETDIKCFFLEALPVALQALLKSHNLHRFSEEECAVVDSLGKKVSVLQKEYFMPNDSAVFRNMANVRAMSNDEYARFLFRLPHIPASISITDERIISFLRENTIDGRTFIPSTPDNQWIRSFISRSPYSTDEFIAFYGFSTARPGESAELDFTAEDFSTVEKDMQTYETGTDYIEKLYADAPLLGSVVLSEKNLDILNKNSKKYIGQLLNNSSVKPNLKTEMQIALAVINYAKGWDTEDEAGFWRYITAQFGYRDESGQLRNLLCSCVKDALIRNHRWFVTNAGGNQFKSSIVVHAFSTKRSWLHFCDFLFDFYKTNLDWEYIQGDPMIARMVLALRNKMRDRDDASDEDVEISSKIYYFREGIIKLIMYRPKYATQLVSSMIKRIDGLINHTASAATCYEEQLCDEWMANKLQSISTPKRKDPSGERRTIAIDYTRIKPVYQLFNEVDVRIVFPDVRLARNDFSSLRLTIYHAGHVVEQKALGYYGNELGKTMSGFSVNLEDYLRRSDSDRFAPQLVITCDADEIYNSGKVLFRECLAFRNKTEIDISSCEQGGYSVFVPRTTAAEFVSAEIATIKENAYLKGYYTELQKDFVININGELTAFDNAQGGDTLRVMVPESGSAADYVVNGVRYSIVTGREIIHVISSGQDAEKKYRLAINSELVDMEKLPYEESAGARVYKLAIGNYGVEEISIRLMDLANNRLLLRRNFKIIPTFTYRFNRTYYYSSDDFRDARLRVIAGSEPVREFPVTQKDTRVTVPYQEGELDIPVPVIRVVDNGNNEWDGSNTYWIKDIPQERFLYVKSPSGINAEILLESQPVGTESANAFALGNAVYGYINQNDRSWLRVFLSVSQNGEEAGKYVLGKIAAKEQFIEKPVLKLENSRLTWDLGYGFIGNAAGAFKLNVCVGTEHETSFDLDQNQEVITEELDLPLGEYKYTISKQSGNLFSLQMVNVASGNFFVGDVNQLRFLKHIIQIDSITFEDNAKYEAVRIRPCYIDHIEYKGIQYVGSEDRECPVYTGIMFFINNGKRHEYSSEAGRDNKGNLLYQINPVRIVYINDSTLSITNETGDPEDPGYGFYYYRYYDKYAMVNVYQITDREPIAKKNPYTGKSEQPKNYFLADLYSYTRKGV